MSELNKYIDEAIKRGLVGPEAIAEWVAKELTDQEKFELVVDLLHNAVRQRLHDLRRVPDVGSSATRRTTARANIGINTRYGNPDERLEAILSGQFFTESGWKQLRDMTYEDLLYAANFRRRQADALHGEANRLENLANLLKSLHKPTVGSLPPAQLLRT